MCEGYGIVAVCCSWFKFELEVLVPILNEQLFLEFRLSGDFLFQIAHATGEYLNFEKSAETSLEV